MTVYIVMYEGTIAGVYADKTFAEKVSKKLTDSRIYVREIYGV